MFPSVLVVDDEPSILRSLSGILSDEGFEVQTAGNGYEALQMIEKKSPDLVLLDIWMPGLDGIETLKEIGKNYPSVQVIIITGHGNIETAVNAIKLGAYDLIEKPLSIDKVIVTINNALNFRRLEEENRFLRKKTIEKNSLTGNSPAIVNLKKQIAIVAPTNSWILIRGQNGTGKELVARTIHQLSPRVARPMVDVSCAAIPDELIENELFGQEKGVLAANAPKKRGKFELADNGTIFLDEIGDMSFKSQSKILRVLQQGEFERVGGGRKIKFKARIIATTNKDLEQEIQANNFRKDLYYRLNVVPVKVPSLKERRDDIPLLVETFLDQNAKRNRSVRKTISKDALQFLQNYDWPGNVRELKNMVEHLGITVEKNRIDISDLPLTEDAKVMEETKSIETELFQINNLVQAKKAFASAFLKHKLDSFQGDLARTARIAGISMAKLKKVLDHIA